VPQYLAAAEHEHAVQTELIPAANRINAGMPRLVVDKLERALEMQGKVLVDASVLVVGVTYKPDVADIRESAAIRVLEEALARGARVSYHDPLTPSLTLARDTFTSVPLTARGLGLLDAVLLLTPHSSVDYDLIISAAPLVVDTHSALNPRRGPNVYNIWDPLAWAGGGLATVGAGRSSVARRAP
jgi:UDP-N-acetyl-D-glucosamine dehydrogenase